MDKTCPKCNGPLVQKRGKYGPFLACSNFPTCKHTEKIVYTKQVVEYVPDMRPIEYTFEQKDIFENVQKLINNVLIQANPGSGKTFTLVHAIRFICENFHNARIGYLAFNKKIVDEVGPKINPVYGVDIRTLDSSALRMIKSVYPYTRVDVDKYTRIVKTCGLIPEDDRKELISPITSILGLLVNNLLEITPDNVKFIVDNYNSIGIEYSDYLVEILLDVWKNGQAINNKFVHFVDCQYYAYNHKMPLYDVLLVDEAQDLTKGQLELVKNVLAENGKVIFAGDINQAIYAFRGADAESIQNIVDKFSPKTFGLTLTRRISTEIVKYLKTRFSIQIESAKDGGIVKNITDAALVSECLTLESALVVCRNNAPLVKPCYELIKQGINARINGVDIGEKIINLILQVKNQHNPLTFGDFLNACDTHVNDMFEKFAQAHDKTWLHEKADLVETVKVIAESCESVNDLIVKVQNLFTDKKVDVLFSTIHKAKGLEHKNVIVYQESLIGSKATTETEKTQEENLRWVALTRAMDALILCEG